MNGFLVVVRCEDADLPVRLFAGRKEAEDFVDEMDEDALFMLDEVARAAQGFGPTGATITPLIFEFRDGVGSLAWDELDGIPSPGDGVRHHTSRDRRSYLDGTVTDFVDNPHGNGSEPELRVWFTSRVVRGGAPKEVSRKTWLPMSALEVISKAPGDDAGGEG